MLTTTIDPSISPPPVALGIERVGGFPGEELEEWGGDALDVGDGFVIFGEVERGYQFLCRFCRHGFLWRLGGGGEKSSFTRSSMTMRIYQPLDEQGKSRE